MENLILCTVTHKSFSLILEDKLLGSWQAGKVFYNLLFFISMYFVIPQFIE